MTVTSPEENGPGAARRQTATLMRNLGLAVAVFAVGAMVLLFTDRDGDREARRVRIGPAPGVAVADYVEARHDDLAGAEGSHRAVVSFARYLPDDAAVALAPGAIETWLVAAPGGVPQAADDVGQWRVDFAAAARDEAASLEELIPTVEDEEFERQYEADRDLALEMAEAVEAGDPVVFAVVITADASSLRQLARHEDVRLVDLVEPGAGGAPRGLRPEEREVAGRPPERPTA